MDIYTYMHVDIYTYIIYVLFFHGCAFLCLRSRVAYATTDAVWLVADAREAFRRQGLRPVSRRSHLAERQAPHTHTHTSSTGRRAPVLIR